MKQIKIGKLTVSVHRTLRMPEDRTAHALPRSRGQMTMHRVADYRDSCPENWESEGVFVGMHPTEAAFIKLDSREPLAVVIGGGKRCRLRPG